MTDEEIVRVLCERVMGWPVLDIDGGPEVQSLPVRWRTGEGIGFRTYEEGHAHSFRPLERIEHAWEVRDRLASIGFVTVRNRPGYPEYCGFDFPDDPALRKAEAFAQTAARALCLCALRAVGVEPEGEKP